MHPESQKLDFNSWYDSQWQMVRYLVWSFWKWNCCGKTQLHSCFSPLLMLLSLPSLSHCNLYSSLFLLASSLFSHPCAAASFFSVSATFFFDLCFSSFSPLPCCFLHLSLAAAGSILSSLLLFLSPLLLLSLLCFYFTLTVLLRLSLRYAVLFSSSSLFHTTIHHAFPQVVLPLIIISVPWVASLGVTKCSEATNCILLGSR